MKTNWDKIAEEYAQRGMMNGEKNLGYLEILKLLGDINEKTILDFGCGAGKFSRKLVKQGAKVIATDPTERMIELAIKENTVNIDYHLTNNLEFLEEGSLEGAVAAFVFCGIHSNRELRDSCKEIYRKLKPKTSFVILEPHPTIHQAEYVSGSRILRKGRIVETRLEGVSRTLYDCLRQIDEYKEILTNSGFRVDAIKEPMDKRKQAQYLVIKGIKDV
jgi:SAM-dependent methyltransferase